ncbi:restriction endonuclease subunit S [Streptomyces sp. NPDC056701]
MLRCASSSGGSVTEWADTTLGDFVSLQRGHDLPAPLRAGGSVPVVGSGGLTGWHDVAKAKGPGITIGRAANLGVPTLIESDFWPLNTTLYVTDFKGNDVGFAYHLFRVLDLAGYNSGSVQPMLNRNYIQNVPIRLPGVGEQRAISGVLGALDGKIKSNDRIVELAAESISLYFSSTVWDYGAGGDLPDRYAAGEILDLCERIGNGGTPKRGRPEYWINGQVAWYKTGELLDGPLLRSSEHITSLGLEESSCRLWPEGTVLIALYGATVGKLGILEASASFNQACSALRPKEEFGTLLLFETLKAIRSPLRNLAVGAAQQNISKGVLSSYRVVIPSAEAADRFNRFARPLYRRQVSALKESRALAALRDTLLPQLMSGKLRVRDAERIVEDAV